MTSILTSLSAMGPWSWLILGLVLMALEAVVPGVHFVWFGMAAVVVGAIALAAGGSFDWAMQLGAFAAISVASVFLVRQFARSGAGPSDVPDLNARGAQYVGRTVTVEEAISLGRGKVRVGDTIWLAEGPDTPVGARVTIIGADGAVLRVRVG